MGMEDEVQMGPPNPHLHAGDVAAQRGIQGAPVQVLNCNRLGRQANPPGFRRSFGEWLRRR